LVDKAKFWPEPQVESAIVKLDKIKSQQEIEKELMKKGKINEKEFFKIVKIGFSARRRQIQNNFVGGLQSEKQKIVQCLNKAGLDPLTRAQNLSVDDWLKLGLALKQEAVI